MIEYLIHRVSEGADPHLLLEMPWAGRFFWQRTGPGSYFTNAHGRRFELVRNPAGWVVYSTDDKDIVLDPEPTMQDAIEEFEIVADDMVRMIGR